MPVKGSLGKKYKAAIAAYDREELFSPLEAAEIVKKSAKAKFDESVEVAVRLGVDPRKAEQMIRGTVALPSGTGKTVRIAVFAAGDAVGSECGTHWWRRCCFSCGDLNLYDCCKFLFCHDCVSLLAFYCEFRYLEFRYLTEIHLDDGFAAKDIDENFQLHMIDVDVVDDASEVGKWAFLHAYALADFVFEFW